MKSTKIVCTIGPASLAESTLMKMMKNGMNIVRLNMSHGQYESHKKAINMVRRTAEALEKKIGILMDLQGPKIRTGKLIKPTIQLYENNEVTLTTEEVKGDWNTISINYNPLPQEAEIGDKILLGDGNIELEVKKINTTSVTCKILNGGLIRAYRGINLPDTKISIEALTQKDIEDLEFGLENDVDFFALSFVRRAKDVENLRKRIKESGKNKFIIAKIEKPEAIENFDEILAASDGIMVARGDLGAETSPEDVPIYQKMIIAKCNKEGKPVITATQMMESMIHNPRPTRAEANDVANAIFDGTDGIMLSGETALGSYPFTVVEVMSNIAHRTEKEIYKHFHENYAKARINGITTTAEAICYSACKLSNIIKPTAIIALTMSGVTARLLSKYRPGVPIIAMSPNEQVLRQLSIYWGIHGMTIETAQTSEELIDLAEIILLQNKLCQPDDNVIMVGGVPVMSGAPSNMVKIHKISLGEKNF